MTPQAEKSHSQFDEASLQKTIRAHFDLPARIVYTENSNAINEIAAGDPHINPFGVMFASAVSVFDPIETPYSFEEKPIKSSEVLDWFNHANSALASPHVQLSPIFRRIQTTSSVSDVSLIRQQALRLRESETDEVDDTQYLETVLAACNYYVDDAGIDDLTRRSFFAEMERKLIDRDLTDQALPDHLRAYPQTDGTTVIRGYKPTTTEGGTLDVDWLVDIDNGVMLSGGGTDTIGIQLTPSDLNAARFHLGLKPFIQEEYDRQTVKAVQKYLDPENPRNGKGLSDQNRDELDQLLNLMPVPNTPSYTEWQKQYNDTITSLKASNQDDQRALQQLEEYTQESTLHDLISQLRGAEITIENQDPLKAHQLKMRIIQQFPLSDTARDCMEEIMDHTEWEVK